MSEAVFFFLFAGLAAAGVLFMVFTKQVIHGAYALALVLLSVAALFVLLNAEFLAVVQIFMYAGGVVVLLVFGIMITNRSKRGTPTTGHRTVAISMLIVVALLFILAQAILDYNPVWRVANSSADQTKWIGRLLLTDHLLAFELIAVLLLVALVGASFLAKKSGNHE
jgi:NADH-quinone oxidoreductase subunit J